MPATRQPFSDPPQTEWDATKGGANRNMTLLRDFVYTDPKNKPWRAPRTFVTDGASIPRAFWTLVGSPYTGRYRRAALVHDKACDDAGKDPAKRLAADKMFYSACRDGGCTPGQALVLFIGVRFGAWLGFGGILEVDDDDAPRLAFTAAEQKLHADFRWAGEELQLLKIPDDPDSVAVAVDRVLAQLYPTAAAKVVPKPKRIASKRP